MREQSFLEYVKAMSYDELLRKRKFYLTHHDSISIMHARAVKDEIAKRKGPHK
jgi:hypothetical protein